MHCLCIQVGHIPECWERKRNRTYLQHAVAVAYMQYRLHTCTLLHAFHLHLSSSYWIHTVHIAGMLLPLNICSSCCLQAVHMNTMWYCMLKDRICAHLVVVVDEGEDLHTVHALSVHPSCTHSGMLGAQKEPHILTTCGCCGIHAVSVTYLHIATCISLASI